MRLKYQLFLILLLSGAVLISLMAVIGSWSFNRGFIGYINDTERQRLVPVIQALAAEFTREGDWRWIENDRRRWRELLDTHRRIERSSGSVGWAPSRPGALPPHGANAPLTLDPRLLHANANRHVLIGRGAEDPRVCWQPITIEDRPVGYLGYRERQTLPGQIDQAFAA